MKDYFSRPRTVVSPARRTWVVRRQVLPRIPRIRWFRKSRRQSRRSHEPSWWDDLDSFDPLVGAFNAANECAPVLGAVLAILIVLVAVFWVLPVLIFLLDVLLVIILAAGGIAIRVFFRRPWKIVAQAQGSGGRAHAWAVVGTRASARAVGSVARALIDGIPLETLNPGPPITP